MKMKASSSMEISEKEYQLYFNRLTLKLKMHLQNDCEHCRLMVKEIFTE